MQDAERRVVVAGDDDQLALRQDLCSEPNEQPMLCDTRRCKILRQSSEGTPHAGASLAMAPPIASMTVTPNICAHWCDQLIHVLEG
jgi:hypothetical protein